MVRDTHRSSGMPRLRMMPSSSLGSESNVTIPSMSLGVSPASSMAALDASMASWISLRPEFLENSVWPIPTIAVSVRGMPMARDARTLARPPRDRYPRAVERNSTHEHRRYDPFGPRDGAAAGRD